MNYTLRIPASDFARQIEADLLLLPSLKANYEKAKADLDASPYANASKCSKCGGSGRIVVGGCVGYDEYDWDEELCDHCVAEGYYPWDTDRKWFDESKVSLDPNLDEDEREEEIRDLIHDQAYDVDLDAPEVVKAFDKPHYAYSIQVHCVYNDLECLLNHLEMDGKDTSWVIAQLDIVGPQLNQTTHPKFL